MTSIEEEWEKFCEDEDSFVPVNNILDQTETKEIPKCGNIYISTKTKIAYLDTKIPLQEIFWEDTSYKILYATRRCNKKTNKNKQ